MVGSEFSKLYDDLGVLYDLRVESSMVNLGFAGPNTFSAAIIDRAVTVSDQQLRTLVSKAEDWVSHVLIHGGGYRLPPLLRMAGILSTRNISRSFGTFGSHGVVLPGWGYLFSLPARGFRNQNVSACTVSNDVYEISKSDVRHLASAWTAHLRAMLSLEPAGPDCTKCELQSKLRNAQSEFLIEFDPARRGIAEWEFHIVSRKRLVDLIQDGVRSLRAIGKLVSGRENLEVTDILSELVAKSADVLRSAMRSGPTFFPSSMRQRLLQARQGLSLSLDALSDDHLVGLSFFSWEYTGAVYLPIGLPVIVPCLAAVGRVLTRVKWN